MHDRNDQSSGLSTYREKRSPDVTPEPFGDPAASPLPAGRPLLYVIQKHAARHLHYDLRLEISGALHSWALPKGLTVDPEEKRAAFETEDHPLEYADFEGIIPPGNYGGGAVIVWDRGFFFPLEDPEEGLAAGKLLFELKGYKLAGLWTLVRTKKNAKEWLLIKKPPGWGGRNGYRVANDGPLPGPPGEESILSGLTVEELRDGPARGDEIRRRLEALGAERRPVVADGVEVMKPATAAGPFSAPGWTFELKYDGFRMLAAREDGRPRLLYRSGHDATDLFPDLARAVAALPFSLVMDGEAVVLDARGKPDFGRLQRRGLLSRRADALQAALADPATLYLFDLLGWEDFDLRALPLAERKAILQQILPRAGPLRFADDLPQEGEYLFREVTRLGLEGVVAKKIGSPYRAGRSSDWLKIRADRVADFVILGWTPVSGQRAGIGKLHLGLCEGRPPGLRRPGGDRLRLPGTQGDPRPDHPPEHPRRPERPLRAAPRLGRARARLRGPLQGVDEWRQSPPAGLRPAARRQAAGRVPAAGRRGARGGTVAIALYRHRRHRRYRRHRRHRPPAGKRRPPLPKPRGSAISTRFSGRRRATPRAIS